MDVIAESKSKVIHERDERRKQTVPIQSPEERDRLVRAFHPDYKKEEYHKIQTGPNAGERTVREVAELLESDSPVPADLDLTPQYRVDVLVVGGGGAGATAALTAKALGADVLLVTKLRMGDSNTVMAQGGMQVAITEDDSPVTHFFDTLRGGHLKNDPKLLKVLVEEGPKAAQWLIGLGVLFDRDESGNLKTKKGGGSTKPRLLTCSDYTGLEIMRVLKDEVLNQRIPILEFSPVVELLTDPDGRCSGAVLKNMDNDQFIVVEAKSVILATGGSGRLHIEGFPTSNHYGATGDALVLAYRTGAKLAHADTFQYHPTGAVFPEQLAGALVTEGIRSDGGHLVNRNGKRFVNELDTRDVVAASIIRECAEGRGVKTPAGRVGVWLDIPMIDLLLGEGNITKRFPAMVRQFERYGIDIRKEPVLIYPTLHYQNGGVAIDTDGQSQTQGLFVAGEASGGLHGRNRLMGNSLLDLIVFGKRAGAAAAQRAKSVPAGKLTLSHVTRFQKELEKNGIKPKRIAPIILPDYVRRAEIMPAAAAKQ
ncbi:MAG: FAD-binding protein [Nitrospirae bacterium]|nr:FAD-binding protein [Nitrospirota bacterium]